jgi:hypothetical protein
MSIQAPQGILNIPNATLRVGKLVLDEIVGADTIMNTVARNTILLVDDTEYTANKNWALKLPNAWAGVFDIKTTGAGKYAEFNFYNEGASSNAQGYNLTFNDTTVELRYDGGSALVSGTVSTVVNTYRKVHLLFERNILSVTVDGTLIFTYTDTGGPRPRVYSTTAGGFLNFFTDGGAIDTLKIVNEKWISDGTSNIAYMGGNLGIGVAAPGSKLSVTGNAYVSSNLEVGTSDLFVDTVNSRVGIGTTTPARPLEIAGDGGTAIINLKRTDTGTGQGGLAFLNNLSNVVASVTASRSGTEGGELIFRTVPDDTTQTSDNPYLIPECMRIDKDGNVGIGTNAPGSLLHVKGDIIGRPISKTRTITKGTSLSGHIENFAFEPDENRILLNNNQGSVSSSRDYTANFITDVPTTIGTIIDLEINSSRTNSSASGVNHRTTLQFNSVDVLSTGNIYLPPNGGANQDSFQRNMKRTIILTTAGWVDYSLYPKISMPVTDDAIVFSTTNNNQQTSVGTDNPLTEIMRVTGNGRVGIGTDAPTATLDVKGSIRANTAVSSLPISLPPGAGMSNYVFGFPTFSAWTTIFSAPATSLFAFWIKIGQSDNTSSSGIFGIIPRHSYFDNTIYSYGHNTGYVRMSGGNFQAYYNQNSGGYGNVAYLTIMRIV